MSRLQAGGLALVIGFEYCPHNLGKVVKLEAHIGVARYSNGSIGCDVWEVSGDILNRGFKEIGNMHCESKYLMPLGDKQTQDELAKEREIENA